MLDPTHRDGRMYSFHRLTESESMLCSYAEMTASQSTGILLYHCKFTSDPSEGLGTNLHTNMSMFMLVNSSFTDCLQGGKPGDKTIH